MCIFEKLKKLFSSNCCTSGDSCCVTDCKDKEGNQQDCDKKRCCKIRKFLCCFIKSFIMFIICAAVLFPVFRCCIFPRIAHKYLVENPEVIIESVQKFSEKKQKEMQKASSEKASELYKEIISEENTPFIGNKNGTHIIVSFYDYACGYCAKFDSELQKLIKSDGQVKVILKDLPLFGENSELAAKASLYVFSKHKASFEKFHTKLISSKGINVGSVIEAAKFAGINEDVVAISKNLFQSELKKSRLQATEMMVDGTPAILINGKLHIGFRSSSELADLLK